MQTKQIEKVLRNEIVDRWLTQSVKLHDGTILTFGTGGCEHDIVSYTFEIIKPKAKVLGKEKLTLMRELFSKVPFRTGGNEIKGKGTWQTMFEQPLLKISNTHEVNKDETDLKCEGVGIHCSMALKETSPSRLQVTFKWDYAM